MVVDFLNTAGHLILALFLLRWLQLKLPTNSDFNKALSYLLH